MDTPTYISLFSGAGGERIIKVISEKHSTTARANIKKAHAKQKKNDGLTANQRYYAKNKEKISEKVAKWRAENSERAAIHNKRSYAKTADSRRENKKRYWREVARERSKTDAGRLADRLRKQLRRKAGRLTKEDWMSVVSAHCGRCAYCGSDGKLTIDHIIPISKGGRNEKNNVVPACQPCNSSRGSRYRIPPRIKGLV